MADYPYFPLYVEDFAMGTAGMSPTAVGIYARCLCYQWSHGFVPNDRTAIARLAGALPSEVDECWEPLIVKMRETSPGKLQNARLEKERAEMLDKVQRRSEAGRAGADARWNHGNRNATAIANALPTQSGRNSKTMARASDSDSVSTSDLSGTQSSSPSPQPSKTKSGGDSALDSAWEEVEEDLLECGVAAAREAVDALRANKCTPSDATNVISFWRLSSNAWGAGALYQRLLNLRPGQNWSTLWPEKSEQAAKVESRRSSDQSHNLIAAQRIEGERIREEETAARKKLDDKFGKKLDAMGREEIADMIRKTFPTESDFMLRRLPAKGPTTGTLREALLAYLDVSTPMIQANGRQAKPPCHK